VQGQTTAGAYIEATSGERANSSARKARLPPHGAEIHEMKMEGNVNAGGRAGLPRLELPPARPSS